LTAQAPTVGAMADLYCVQHAELERLVAATGVVAGKSTCAAHGHSTAEPLQGYRAANCVDCRRTRHRAYFVVDHEPLCIRHAADALFPEDDMGAHDMAHAAYIRLNAMAVGDAY
jgi:hypothetical protein